VGDVVEVGYRVQGYWVGDRVGVPRLGWACGKCPACLCGFEHLCRTARLIGLSKDGGMAEYSRDVANLISLVTTSPIQPAVETFQMAAAEEALARLQTGRMTGSVVLLAD
jgi:D-arabinose 1-dehydrogenase-like Zn-dependent alcohol dehydrogenase